MRLAFHSRKKVGCLNSPHSHHQRADSNVLPGTGSPARERHAKTRWPFIALGRPFLYLPRHHSQCVADIIGACRPLSASQPAFRRVQSLAIQAPGLPSPPPGAWKPSPTWEWRGKNTAVDQTGLAQDPGSATQDPGCAVLTTWASSLILLCALFSSLWGNDSNVAELF